jgi:hypothetical protein
MSICITFERIGPLNEQPEENTNNKNICNSFIDADLVGAAPRDTET